ncbi:hypothetical protein Dimus_034451 [Dionaea muscipula]
MLDMLKHCLGKLYRPKPKSPPTSPEGEKESKEGSNNGGLRSTPNVSEEYREVFRTRSYTDIFTKVQAEMGTSTTSRNDHRLSHMLSSSSSRLPLYIHLSDCLLEPGQDIVLDLINNSDLHQLLLEYFDVSLEAFNACEIILRSIHQSRANYKLLRRAIRGVAAGAMDHDQGDDQTDEQAQAAVVQNLTIFASLANPLSIVISRNKLSSIHNRLACLLHQLISRHRRLKRRLKFIKLCKRAAGITLVISYSTLVIVVLVLGIHSIIGLALLSCLGIPRITSMPGNSLKRLSLQLDLAAKGVYILTNDLNTMWRLTVKLHDDVEHTKVLADICVRNGQCQQVLKEAMRELNTRENAFLEQLKELEDHVYLCFVTINKSRRLVMEEIMESQKV